MPASLRPFRYRDYALLWSAGMVSNTGTWMQSIAVTALVAGLTKSSGWTGLAAAAAFLPMGVLAPVGGALADRVDRRRFLMLTNLGEAGMAAVLATLAATGRASPGAVIVVVFAASCVSALSLPFYQSVLPDLVPREELVGAISLNSAQWNLGRVVGPTLAGVVVAAGGFAWAFAINSASFFATIGALALIRVGPPRGEEASLWERIRAGARTTWATRGCRVAIALVSAVAFTVAPFIGLVAANAQRLTGGGPVKTAKATAALTTAQGIGAVVGALLLASLTGRFGHRRTVVTAVLLTAAAAAAYANMPTVPAAVVALALLGLLYIWVLAGLSTIVQLHAPAEFRGRILSFHWLALGTIYPLGTLVEGGIADRIGLPLTLTLASALLGAGLLAVLLLRPHWLDPLEPPRRPVSVSETPTTAPATGAGPAQPGPAEPAPITT